MQTLKALGKFSAPLYLLLSALTYFMGAGMARYLGSPVHSRGLLLGLAIMLLLQAAMAWLGVAFRPATEILSPADSPQDGRDVRRAALYAAVAALATTAALAYSLLRAGEAPIAAMMCLGTSLLIILAYAIPPLRALNRGFGELFLAVQVGYLSPALSFILQAGEYHLLPSVCSAALTLQLLAALIVFELPAYVVDPRRGHVNLLTIMGWERGLVLHHSALAGAYVLLAWFAVFEFSVRVLGPAFLTIPFATLQILHLRGVARGAKPIWNLLRANALAILGLTTYLLTLSFWLH